MCFFDLFQLIFDAFKVGRYEATELDGCPDGYMQLSELGRPFTGGSWCGSSTGYAVYYSETSTITVSVKLFHSPQSVPFEFHLRYKFVSQLEAVVRFGSPAAPLERGQVSPGTYCTRQFDECRFKPCRLQSPNYPGMYPRNVTCYWSLHQKEVPTCKHAMIAVRQESAHKMQMKRSISMASLNKTNTKALRAWRECTGERDHLIFYDGPSTNDPVLVKYCGGDWLPRVVSHGPWMLVAFHSSPFSIPLHSNTAHSPLRGFELDVDVIFADSDSLDYSRESRRCEFDVNATNADDLWEERGRRGRLLSPRHTLPPNTTCTYKFHGQPGDLVWVYFISYSHRPLLPPPSATEGPDGITLKLGPNTTMSDSCTTRLRIWDGGGHDARIMADHCDDELPRLCDHTSLSNLTRITRPCSPRESYVSTNSKMIIQHHTEDGTALHPASFRLRYEFVDTRLGGDPWTGRRAPEAQLAHPHACSRVFRKMRSGEVSSPRNVFMYGRGGSTNLSCVYRLEAGPGEKIRLMIHNVSFGENPGCETEPDPHTARPRCVPVESGRLAELRVIEVPWREVRIPRACICDNFTLSPANPRPLVFLSSSRYMELHFTLTKMNITEDFRDLYFFATFEMIRMPECPRKQRLRGSGGEVEFVNPPLTSTDMYCEGMPWLVEAHENRSLFLLTWGTFLPLEPSQEDPARCGSKNRVLIYSGRPARLIRVVCPAEPNARQFAVHVFSEEWFGGGGDGESQTTITYLQPPRPPSFLVECVSREPGIAAFNWLEISRSRSALLQQLQIEYPGYNGNLSLNDTFLPPDWECPYRCPELDACISASLWCDGRPNCPSGYDENEVHCGVGRRFFKIFPGGIYTALSCAAAVIAALLLLGAFGVAHRIRTRRRRRRLGKKKLIAGEIGVVGSVGPRRIPTEEMLLDPGSTMSS